MSASGPAAGGSWDELVAAALIGTDRRPIEAEGPPGLHAALAQRGVEDRLLAAAAGWAVARRAGARAGAPRDVVPAALDQRPLVGAERLRMLLEDDEELLLGEWLERVHELGRRPPPEHVPALLELASRRVELQEAVIRAAGPLGSWLGEKEPRWAFAGGGDPAEVWTAGTRAQRRLLLRRLRRSDPASARALVESTFAEEPWEDRQAFVELLATGLSEGDEPFLETALTDSRAGVREAAAALLVALPRSRYAQRAAAAAKPLLTERDGVLHATLPAARGRRSERLTGLLSEAPLDTWDLGWVDLPVADDLADAVHAGWVNAAKWQRNPDWARALWRLDPELLAVLPREEAEPRAAAAEDPFAAALALEGRWGLPLSRTVLALVPQRKERGLPVSAAGYRLAAGLEEQVEALRELGGRDVLHLCDVYATRAAMLRELG